MANIFDNILKIIGLDKDTKEKTNINNLNELIISKEEFRSYIDKTYVDKDRYTDANQFSLLDFLQTQHSSILSKKLDSIRLKELAPEIEDAALLLVSSILSPNNLMKYELNIQVDSDVLDEEQKNDIVKLLSEHFNKKLKLQDRLYNWIYQTLFETGSKPILILPEFLVTEMRNNQVSFESLNSALEYYSGETIYKEFPYNDSIKDIEIDKELIRNNLKTAIENLDEAQLSKLFNGNNKDKKVEVFLEDNSEKIVNTLKEVFKKYEVNKQVKMIDNPKVLAYGIKNVEKTKKDLMDKFNKKLKYKQESFIDLTTFLNSEEESKFPSLIELPSEAVIPVIIPGSPDNHIGYFVLLDETGQPIAGATDSIEEKETIQSEKESKLIRDLYKTVFGSANQFNVFRSSNMMNKLINDVYNKYVDNFIKSNLSNIGFNGVEVKITNDITKLMFYRLLEKKKTHLLFVPSDLLTYIAFSYNKYGIGKSKIESITFALGLKITFLVTRILAMMEAATNRRRIEVDFDKNIGNPLELMKLLRKYVIQSKLVNFSYEPSKVIKSLAERSVSIVPKSIPGIENFNISDEAYKYEMNSSDTDLLEEINNMYIIGLSVPPNALNNLRESEFSRSIVTNNILFSLKVTQYQNILIKFISNILQTYVLYSSKLQEEILNILGKKSKKNKKDKKSSISDKNKKLLTDIIQNIHITLPSPKIAHDKSLNEEVQAFVSAINDLIDNYLPKELVVDRDLQDSLDAYKAYIKHKIIGEFLDKTFASGEFDIAKFKDVDADELSSFVQSVLNSDKAVKDLLNNLKTEEESGY